MIASNSEHWLLPQRAGECERLLRQHFEQRARAGRAIHLPRELRTQRQRNARTISSLHVASREGILFDSVYECMYVCMYVFVCSKELLYDFFLTETRRGFQRQLAVPEGNAELQYNFLRKLHQGTVCRLVRLTMITAAIHTCMHIHANLCMCVFGNGLT